LRGGRRTAIAGWEGKGSSQNFFSLCGARNSSGVGRERRGEEKSGTFKSYILYLGTGVGLTDIGRENLSPSAKSLREPKKTRFQNVHQDGELERARKEGSSARGDLGSGGMSNPRRRTAFPPHDIKSYYRVDSVCGIKERMGKEGHGTEQVIKPGEG